MVRFVDKDGFWVDTDKDETALKSYYESLVPSMNPTSSPDSALGGSSAGAKPVDSVQLLEVVGRTKAAQDAIETYTAEFRPVAETPSGEDQLKKMLSNQEAPKEQRAAAAQALYPGMKAGIGATGELSFSAKAGDSLGFNYPGQVKTNEQKTNRIAGIADEMDKFDQQFKAVQGMDDPNDIANTYASLSATVNSYISAKQEAARQTIGRALGVDKLEKQLEVDRRLDQEYHDRYLGGGAATPSTESEATIQAFQRARQERDLQVDEMLKSDPSIVQMRTKLQVMENLVSTRLGETLPTDTGVFVDDSLVDQVLLVQGVEGSKATSAQRQQLKKEIENNSPKVQAMLTIAEAPISQKLTAAATASGIQSTWAMNAAKAEFDTPDMPEQLIAEFKQFDAKYLPNIPENQQSEYKLGVAASTGGLEAQREAKAQIDNMKMNYILQKYNDSRRIGFEQSMTQWAPPQDLVIQNEFKAVFDTVQSAKARTNDESPIFIDELIGRFDFSGSDATVKIEALADYIASQAQSSTDQKVFGPIPMYSDRESVRGFINAKVISGRMQEALQGRSYLPYQPNPL